MTRRIFILFIIACLGVGSLSIAREGNLDTRKVISVSYDQGKEEVSWCEIVYYLSQAFGCRFYCERGVMFIYEAPESAKSITLTLLGMVAIWVSFKRVLVEGIDYILKKKGGKGE